MLTTWLENGESEHMKLESLSYLHGTDPARVLITQHRLPPRKRLISNVCLALTLPVAEDSWNLM